VRAARADGARVVLDGHGGEHSATCVPQGYLAELFLAARWRTLARELRCYDRNRRITIAAAKRQVLKPLLPWSLLRLLNRHNTFSQMVEYPLRADYIRDILGRDVDQVRQQVTKLLTPGPSHRRNMARSIGLARSDLRARSHAGLIDYQEVTFSYPYLDKRVLEFSLAVDGRFKYHNGRGRRLLGLGMGDSMPPAILNRRSKAPFSPDYHLRYEMGRSSARARLQDFSRNQKLSPFVDFEKVVQALEHPAAYSARNPMRMDYGSQFLVPFALYLCYFLDSFAAGTSAKGMQS
jgi:asparagine synthase (glutamine-hydrolysing)